MVVGCSLVILVTLTENTTGQVLFDHAIFTLEDEGSRRVLSSPAHGDYELDHNDDQRVEDYIDINQWEHKVISFTIEPSILGIYISSYDIQERGSQQAAGGQDRFMVLDLRSGKLNQDGLDLGKTKQRYRFMGMDYATSHNIYLADVNQNGLLDIGVMQEDITWYREDSEFCPVREGPFYCTKPTRWFIFSINGWHESQNTKKKLTEMGAVKIPLIGITKTPVDYTRDVYGNQVKPCPSEKRWTSYKERYERCMSSFKGDDILKE